MFSFSDAKTRHPEMTADEYTYWCDLVDGCGCDDEILVG